MQWLPAALVTGAITFAATNIDDIFILMLFFSQVNRSFHRWHIVVGQYLGFTALVLISLPGFLLGLVIPGAWMGLLGIVPILLGVRHWLNRAKEEKDKEAAAAEAQASAVSKAGSFTAVTSVASVTFANGGDNIGIYTPLFAGSDLPEMIVTLCVFYSLLAVWCYAGYVVTTRRMIAHTLARYGHTAVPFVLIGLGIYIVIENGSLTLLGIDL